MKWLQEKQKDAMMQRLEEPGNASLQQGKSNGSEGFQKPFLWREREVSSVLTFTCIKKHICYREEKTIIRRAA